MKKFVSLLSIFSVRDEISGGALYLRTGGIATTITGP